MAHSAQSHRQSQYLSQCQWEHILREDKRFVVSLTGQDCVVVRVFALDKDTVAFKANHREHIGSWSPRQGIYELQRITFRQKAIRYQKVPKRLRCVQWRPISLQVLGAQQTLTARWKWCTWGQHEQGQKAQGSYKGRRTRQTACQPPLLHQKPLPSSHLPQVRKDIAKCGSWIGS